jgi:hypothetical protein
MHFTAYYEASTIVHQPLFIPPTEPQEQFFVACQGMHIHTPPEKPTMTTALLPNFFSGRWQTGTDAGTPLFDPVLGTELARVSSRH